MHDTAGRRRRSPQGPRRRCKHGSAGACLHPDLCGGAKEDGVAILQRHRLSCLAQACIGPSLKTVEARSSRSRQWANQEPVQPTCAAVDRAARARRSVTCTAGCSAGSNAGNAGSRVRQPLVGPGTSRALLPWGRGQRRTLRDLPPVHGGPVGAAHVAQQPAAALPRQLRVPLRHGRVPDVHLALARAPHRQQLAWPGEHRARARPCDGLQVEHVWCATALTAARCLPEAPRCVTGSSTLPKRLLRQSWRHVS